MQKVKKLSIVLLALMWWMTVMLTVLAATKSQDGVEVTVTTDRQNYSSDQSITATITVKNNNAFAVTDVTLESLVPNGYKLKEGDLTKTVEALFSGG